LRRGGLREEVGVGRVPDSAQPRRELARAGDRERRRATRVVLLDDQERDAAEVVAVKMRDRDRIDAVGGLRAHDRRQRRAAAVEQERNAGCGQVDARMRAAAVGERVARAVEADADGHAISESFTVRCSRHDLPAASPIRSASSPSAALQRFGASPRANRRKYASSALYASPKRTKNEGYAGPASFGASFSTERQG